MSAPAVAVSEKHRKVAFAWKDMREGEPNLYWRTSADLSPADDSLVHESTAGVQDHPSLAIDGSGRVWVAWEDVRDGQRDIRVRTRDGQAINLTASDDERATYPCIASHDQTTAVVWESGAGREKTIRFRTLSATP